MANKKLDLDQIFQLVSQCRQSGKSDRQWCLDNDINPSTFYYWIKILRRNACHAIPNPPVSCSHPEAGVHDIVRLDLSPDQPTRLPSAASDECPASPAITLYIGNTRMAIAPSADARLIKDTLCALRGVLC